MKHSITIEARKFEVTAECKETKEVTTDSIILTKAELQAAQLIGSSSKGVICGIYGKKGYAVLDIGKAQRRTLTVDLDALWYGAMLEDITTRKYIQEDHYGGEDDA